MAGGWGQNHPLNQKRGLNYFRLCWCCPAAWASPKELAGELGDEAAVNPGIMLKSCGRISPF